MNTNSVVICPSWVVWVGLPKVKREVESWGLQLRFQLVRDGKDIYRLYAFKP